MDAKLDNLSEISKLLSVKSKMSSDILSLFSKFGLGRLLCRLSLEKHNGISAIQLILSLCLLTIRRIAFSDSVSWLLSVLSWLLLFLSWLLFQLIVPPLVCSLFTEEILSPISSIWEVTSRTSHYLCQSDWCNIICGRGVSRG